MTVDFIGIAAKFLRNKWEWNFREGGHRIPNMSEIEHQVNLMRDELASRELDEDSTLQLETGRLILIRDADGYDLFTYEGRLG